MAVGADTPAITMHMVVHYFFSSAVFLAFLATAAGGSPLSNCKANSVNCSEMRISDFETVESCCVNRLMSIDPPCIKGLSKSKAYIAQSPSNGTTAAFNRFWRDIQAFFEVFNTSVTTWHMKSKRIE